MSDRHLYKAKRKDNGEWVEGYYFCMGHNDGRHVHHFIIPLNADLSKGRAIDDIQVEVDPSTICQCAGVKDRNGWIPCSERMPEESLNSVLGWDEYRKRCCLVQYVGGRWILGNDIDSVNITAWQPLPGPYQQRELNKGGECIARC